MPGRSGVTTVATGLKSMIVLIPGYPYAAYGTHSRNISIAQGCIIADMSWGSHQDLAEWCSAQAEDCYDDVSDSGWIILVQHCDHDGTVFIVYNI